MDTYLRRSSIMSLAREAYGLIAERLDEGAVGDARKIARDDLGALRTDEELMLTHLLSWSILPAEINQRRDKKALKQAAMDLAVSDHQCKRLEEDWSDERIELIFDIARLGMDAGRHPDIYISSTFNNGAGLYLAVGLDHPQDSSKQIVVADNPVCGNALYFVDELNTQTHDGIPYAWNEVLGASKKIARDRGATRRYHTGNWVEVARAVCEYTGEHRKRETPVIAPETPAPVEILQTEAYRSAEKRLELAFKLAAAAREAYRAS
jgi:hypothetical protein